MVVSRKPIQLIGHSALMPSPILAKVEADKWVGNRKISQAMLSSEFRSAAIAPFQTTIAGELDQEGSTLPYLRMAFQQDERPSEES